AGRQRAAQRRVASGTLLGLQRLAGNAFHRRRTAPARLRPSAPGRRRGGNRGDRKARGGSALCPDPAVLAYARAAWPQALLANLRRRRTREPADRPPRRWSVCCSTLGLGLALILRRGASGLEPLDADPGREPHSGRRV